MISLDDFIQQWSGKKCDFDGAYQGQCTDLFRQYNQDVLGINQPKGVVGAADFWTNYETDPNLLNNFEKIPNTDTFKPIKGDVMVWNKKAGGGYGHIAIVSDNKATLSKFFSFDQNWRALNVCEITEHTYTNCYGVLRPKKSQEICLDKETFERLVTKSTWYDTHFEEYQTLSNQKTENEQFKKTIEHRLEVLAGNLSTIIDWDEVVNASARFKSIDAQNLELQDKLDREIKESAKKVAEYELKLEAFKEEMRLLKEEHAKQIKNISDRVDKEIAELQKAKEKYENTNRIIDWIKSIFNKKG
jgi:hypothetical protein